MKLWNDLLHLFFPRLCLLCDEPLSALDSQRSHVIIDFLKKKIRQHMIPTLYVTHALEEIALLTDHQYEML